ncbi:thiopurine S-methyltransferase [Legionella shakespearei]|uniref:Thiopurine S-methyltransferase n=1 Tax=Legionella shakespearei DSM 23087 TaxID=1122169 RepID=A0A0W0YKY3_9GAMM|nr:thiopurine S-methyltransferase [Legionella shakespearei]KTD57467.1 thiopurine S-methyltransferase [Legionella shakespearei DSM 23087]
MNKGQQFWLDLWHEGRTSFHKGEVNPDLSAFWPEMNLPADSSVLVPLCGKSLDMLWLCQQGLYVTGIELSEQAVQQFADEHQIEFQQERFGTTRRFFTDRLQIWVADVFILEPSLISSVDALYDRAALIALPQQLRSAYARRCLNWLKHEGRILLKTMHYDQEAMEGPPYSVSDEEVRELYKSCSEIRCVKQSTEAVEKSNHLHDRGLHKATNSVWCMKK